MFFKDIPDLLCSLLEGSFQESLHALDGLHFLDELFLYIVVHKVNALSFLSAA